MTDRVELDDIRVMCARASEGMSTAIQRAWAEFERAVGLTGRKFYGAYDLDKREYRVCTQIKPDDDPASFGFDVATLPGGTFLRARLRGEPQAIYSKIAPTFDQLTKDPRADASRPSIEFYRRRDVIDLLLPIT